MDQAMLLRTLFPLLGLLLLLTGCGSQAQAVVAAPPLPERAAVAAPPAADPVLPERLVIPAIDLDIPVVELGWSTKKNAEGSIFSEWEVAQYAAGWHKNSARLGEPGNIVMSGHNNILGAVFRELDQLRRGDTITVAAKARTTDYVVHDVLIVPEKFTALAQRKENARWIGQFDDDRLTLVSCWPRDDNTHRIIVVAFPAQAQ
jgi:sortase A